MRHLRIIAELDELGFVARVAEKLSVSQPAVSKQIAEIEDIVGDPVVVRLRNRLHLTPVGRRLAEHARKIGLQIERAAFDLEAMATGVSGSVRIGVVSSVAPLILPSAIAMLKRGAPETTVSMINGHFVSLLPQLESGQIDLLIARVWQSHDIAGLDQKVLLREAIVVVAGRDHPLAKETTLSWQQVVDNPWILPQPNSVARQAVDSFFASRGLNTPSNTVVSISLSLNLELLRHMPILGLFPKSLALSHAARGDLVILPLDIDGFLSEARCFWKPETLEASSAVSLMMHCLNHSAEERYDHN